MTATYTIESALKTTVVDIQVKPVPEVATIYNTLAGYLGLPIVKRFADRQAAVRRTVPLLERAQEIYAQRHPAPVVKPTAAVVDEVQGVLDAAAERAVKGPGKAKAPKVAAPKTAAPKTARANGGASISSAIKQLIADGLDNAAIWAIVQPQFNMPDNHKNYPAWYRRSVTKAGR